MGVTRSFGVVIAVFMAAILCGGCGSQAVQTPGAGEQSVVVGEAAKEEQQETAEEKQQETPEDGKLAKSIEEIYREIEQAVELKSPVCMDNQFIENYYGMDTAALEEYVFSISEDAAQAETVIIMKVKDESDMVGIAECLKTVVEEKKNEMANYIPEQFAIVEKSEVVEKDNYIWLVISENADVITDVIESGLF